MPIVNTCASNSLLCTQHKCGKRVAIKCVKTNNVSSIINGIAVQDHLSENYLTQNFYPMKYFGHGILRFTVVPLHMLLWSSCIVHKSYKLVATEWADSQLSHLHPQQLLISNPILVEGYIFFVVLCYHCWRAKTIVTTSNYEVTIFLIYLDMQSLRWPAWTYGLFCQLQPHSTLHCRTLFMMLVKNWSFELWNLRIDWSLQKDVMYANCPAFYRTRLLEVSVLCNTDM